MSKCEQIVQTCILQKAYIYVIIYIVYSVGVMLWLDSFAVIMIIQLFVNADLDYTF